MNQSFGRLDMGLVACLFTFLFTSSAEARRVVKKGGGANGVLSKHVISREGPGLEVEFEMENARSGGLWRVVIKQNGRTLVRTTHTAIGVDGEFEIEALAPNLRGRDRIVAIATSGVQRCVQRARVPFR